MFHQVKRTGTKILTTSFVIVLASLDTYIVWERVQQAYHTKAIWDISQATEYKKNEYKREKGVIVWRFHTSPCTSGRKRF